MRIYQHILFAPALLLLLLAAAFKFDPSSVVWLWHQQPLVAILLAVTSIVLWGVMAVDHRPHLRD